MSISPKRFLWILIVILVFGLYACGGGGGGDESSDSTPPISPSITTQPSDWTVTAGKTATFTVVATGTAPLSYQWRKNGMAISGAASAGYTTPATTMSDNGAKFTVVVTNAVGSVTSGEAILTVTAVPVGPSITGQPQSRTVTAGQTATFTVVAAGTGPLSYQWRKNGMAISGAVSAGYTTPVTAMSDNGARFTVVVTNAVGSVISDEAILTVNNSGNIRWQPVLTDTWQWQLTGVVNTSYDVDVYDVDLFDTPQAVIDALHAAGKKVVAYFSAGSAENWRSDFALFQASDMGNNLDGWPDEKWLDTRSSNVRTIMALRMDLARSKGFDGIEPDNIDGYTNNTGFPLTGTTQLEYNRFLAELAHDRNLAIALKNDVDQLADLAADFDFAVNEECHFYNECDGYSVFINAGKPVFNAEYAAKYVNNTAGARDLLCADAHNRNLRTLVLPLNLDDSFRFSCDAGSGVQVPAKNSFAALLNHNARIALSQTTGRAGGLISPERAFLLAPLKGIGQQQNRYRLLPCPL